MDFIWMGFWGFGVIKKIEDKYLEILGKILGINVPVAARLIFFHFFDDMYRTQTCKKILILVNFPKN